MTFKQGKGGDAYPTAASASATDTLLVSKSSAGRQVLKQVAVQGLAGNSSLNPTSVSAGTYGNGFNVPQITVDETGIVTSIAVIAVGVTSVDTLTNVSVPSPVAGQMLVFSSGEWVASSEYLTSASIDTLFDEYVTSASISAWLSNTDLISDTGVSAGTYGTSAIVPKITVDAKGRITAIVRSTVAGGGAGVNFLTDVGDVSASSLSDGDILAWDAANSEWNPTTNAAGYTSAQVSSRIQDILTSNAYLTSADTDGIYTTSAEVSSIVEAYGYLTSAVTTAQVSSIVENYGYLTSALTTAQASAKILEVVSSAQYYTSSQVSTRIGEILTSNAYITSASLGDLAFLNTITSSGLVDTNALALADLVQLSAKTVIGNMGATSANAGEISVLDEDNMASNSDTALATQQSIKSYVDAQVLSGGGAWTLIASVQVDTSVDEITIVDGSAGIVFDDTYHTYIMGIEHLSLTSSGDSLLLQYSDDAGATYKSGASYDYASDGRVDTVAATTFQGSNSSRHTMAAGIGTGASSTTNLHGIYYFHGAPRTSAATVWTGMWSSRNNNGTQYAATGGGLYQSTSAMNGLKLYSSGTGGITRATIRWWGLK